MRKVVVANWKQNLNQNEVKEWLDRFSELISDQTLGAGVVIAPPHPYLSLVDELAKKHGAIFTCAQDISQFDNGAHTGEVGAEQLSDYCDYSIVGHSERNESRDVVSQKAKKCLEEGIKPIVCFVEKEDGKAIYDSNILLAWEDPQNISRDGKYNPKHPKEIEKGVLEILKLFPKDAQILYGGSVNKENVGRINEIFGINGYLIGNASLDPDHFYEIIKIVS